jgi:hypothetical protein
MKKYESEYDMLKNELSVYLENPVGVGEHSNLYDVIDEKLAKMADLQGKMDVLAKEYEK